MRNDIIAISGKSGCGNSTVSKMVSLELGWELINYTLRNMASEMGLELKDLLLLAQKDDSYDRKLDARQRELAMRGKCVLGSRLAIWLLRGEAFTVYLDGSPDVRYSRIAKREGGSLEDVRSFNEQRDKKDHDRYFTLYGIDNDEHGFADLHIDTEGRTPEDIASLIVRTWEDFRKRNS